MATQYRNHHYVPQWYQRRFIPAEQTDRELFYLHLYPRSHRDSKGRTHVGQSVFKHGPRLCFVEEDLYSVALPGLDPAAIEQTFFGGIDREGKRAVDHFARFEHPSVDPDKQRNLLLYMGTQKLLTPKGLAWLASHARNGKRDAVLGLMMRFRNLFEATWNECVWQIADAVDSETKFIVTDHPVTVYNRRLGPRSDLCKGHNDPDIRMVASHTLFPLSVDKILILTNRAWVYNPYQSEMKLRPNPVLLRPSVFSFFDVQTLRRLSEVEVLQINFILKSRAYRYVAAGREEWLWPERHVSKSDWREFGNGYLLMPDPRAVHFTSEVLLGYSDGRVAGFDTFGRQPWERDYKKESSGTSHSSTLSRFQGEFARLYGQNRRGRSFEHGMLDPERDDDDLHAFYLSLEARAHDEGRSTPRENRK